MDRNRGILQIIIFFAYCQRWYLCAKRAVIPGEGICLTGGIKIDN